MTLTLRISLKTRLLLLVVALVTIVVTAITIVHLNSIVRSLTLDVLERSQTASEQVKTYLIEKLNNGTAALRPPPAGLEQTKRVWNGIVEQDVELPATLIRTMSASRMIVEIAILGEDGRVLASSNPSRVGRPGRRFRKLAEWRDEGFQAQLREVMWGNRDYEVPVDLGVGAKPIFTVQVMVNLVLLREAMWPQVQTVGVVWLASLALSLILAVFVSNLALSPLAAISQKIDRITHGHASEESPHLSSTREFRVVEDKLNVLGQQFRGAREDATQLRSNIEQLLTRLEEAVLLFDPLGRLLMAGPPAERLLEIPRKELPGKRLEDLFPPLTALGSLIQQAIRQGRGFRDHPVVMDMEGRPAKRLLVNVEPLSDGARSNGVLLTLRDAETRRQIASQLDVSSRLTAINRLTGGVAHEIKNPLNAISLRLELLRSKVEESLPEAEEEIGIISREIRRLDRVVKTFLDFTRPVNLVIEPLDLVALVREIAALVNPQAAQQRVRVNISSPEEEIFVAGDRDLLKQAVINIVVNGIEAMKEGGELGLSLRKEGGACTLRISDQGPGIAAEHRPRIFQLYFTTKERGSGIGLAMAFRAVQLHNGTIEFFSEAGTGTSFLIELPLAAEATTVAPAPMAAAVLGGPETQDETAAGKA